MSRVYERMCRFETPEWNIRVWMKLDSLRDSRWLIIHADMQEWVDQIPETSDVEDVISNFATKFEEDTAAVEVTHKGGNGMVIYTEWP